MLNTERNNFGISQADGETDDYNTTRLANNANFEELDKNTAKCNWEATSDPTVNDDASLGYSEGSVWHNIASGKRFILNDATEGAADWWQTYPPVGPIPAEADNLAKLGAAGEIQDSGVNVADVALKVIPAGDGNLVGLDLETGAIEDSGIDPATLARRVAEPTAGHVAGIDADGDLTDSGSTVVDMADAITKKHAAAGDDNFASLGEKTTPTGAMKVPVNDGTYGFMTRQNFLLGVKGGINFITNSDFEGDTVGQVPAGWGTYKDAAQATPEDGTGGSPSVTFLTSEAVILNGGRSARITKPASNCQGEGVNFPFNVPVAYRAGMVRIQLPYVPVDAIATGDFAIWIYDVTNGALIQPTPYQVEGRTAGTPGAVVAEFQAPYNMAQGRLLWHVATTSASQLRVDVDELQVGPGTRVFGPAMTNAKSFTPSWTNVPNITYNTAFWERHGDLCHIWGTLVVSGAVGGQIYLNAPFTIDTTKANGSQRIGIAQTYDSSAAAFYVSSLTIMGATQFGFLGSGGWYAASVPMTWANADEMHYDFWYPVLGWDSCSQQSNDAETRIVEASAYRITSVQTVIAGAAAAAIVFNALRKDTHGAYSIVTGLYTARVPGIYRVNYGSMVLCGATAPTEVGFSINKNGNGDPARGICYRSDLTANKSATFSGNAEIECFAGDTIGIYAYCTGQNISIIATGGINDASYINISRISGPSQIAASEKVYAEYSSNAGNAIADSTVVRLDYEDKVEDTHGSVTVGASWQWVAPRAGVLQYSAQVLIPASGFNGSSEYVNMIAYKNGSVHKYEYMTPPAGAAFVTPKIAGPMKVNAGDVVYFAIYQNSGASLNMSSTAEYNKVSILMN